MKFRLPLPPTKNRIRTRSWQKKLRLQREYMSAVFAMAATQHQPELHPPEIVRLEAMFFVRNLRDEDNLAGSLSWLLDAMKLKQSGDIGWKGNVDRAWFLDDDPRHLRLIISQQIERRDPRLEVTITPGRRSHDGEDGSREASAGNT